MNNAKHKNSSQINQFRLISQFVQESASISKNFQNPSQFISEVKRSRQVINFEPDFNAKYNYQGSTSKDYDQGFGVIFEEKPTGSHESMGLKESFVRSEIDDTTYESLMHEFMGSYLEERLNSKFIQQPLLNGQSYQRKQGKERGSHYFMAPLVDVNKDELLTNQDSQITFSGSKESRIINENQESRVVKEEYFLLDQQKNSKMSKISPSKAKKLRPQDALLDQNKSLVMQSYKLRAPTSPQKLRISAQRFQNKSSGLSKQKVKVQRINLVEQASTKNILGSGMKKCDQKYNISKFNSTHKKTDNSTQNQKDEHLLKDSRHSKWNTNLQNSNHSRLSNSRKAHESHSKSQRKQQPIIIHVSLQKEYQNLDTRFLKNSKSPKSQSHHKSGSKSAKKMNSSNYLKTQKTFNVTSSKWKLQKYPENRSVHSRQIIPQKSKLQQQNIIFTLTKNPKNLSIEKILRLDSPERFIKIENGEQNNIQSKTKQRASCQIGKTFIKPKKYIYEHSYQIKGPDKLPQSSSNINTYHQQYSHMKSSRTQQNSGHWINDSQADIQKDREMIREIKKDLAKLIHKISSTSKKKGH